MATKFFPTDTTHVTDLTANVDKVASLTQGASAVNVVQSTVAGPVAAGTHPILSGVNTLWWFSNPLNAVTISGTVSLNGHGLESNTMANGTVACVVYRSAGDTGAETSQIAELSGATLTLAEVGTTETTITGSSAPTSTALSAGDRLKFVWCWDDATGVTMASGFTFTFFYAGAAGATGDSFISFTEAITEQSVAATVTPPLPVVIDFAVARAANY